MTVTYEKLATTTLSSATATITFSSISGAYTDLVISEFGITSADSGININFNGDTGSNYSFTYMYGDGSSVVSGRDTNRSFGSGGRAGVNGGVGLFNIMNYSNTTTYKTTLSRGSNANALAIAIVTLWRSTSAITSINLTRGGGGNFDAGSTFTLYGILKEA